MVTLLCCVSIMISVRWLEKRKPYWTRLEAIVNPSARKGIAGLTYRELQDLALLYRQVAADLAKVREDPSSHRMADYLNQLWPAPINVIYMGRAFAPQHPAVLSPDFSRCLPPDDRLYGALRSTFCGGRSDRVSHLSCRSGLSALLSWPRNDRTIDRREIRTHFVLTVKPLAASWIMTNNLTVSFATFALGITGGIGTIYMLLTNGLMIGVIAAVCCLARRSEPPVLGSLSHHMAFWNCRAYSLRAMRCLLLARGLLFPGNLPRRESLVIYGSPGGWFDPGNYSRSGSCRRDRRLCISIFFSLVQFVWRVFWLHRSASTSLLPDDRSK